MPKKQSNKMNIDAVKFIIICKTVQQLEKGGYILGKPGS